QVRDLVVRIDSATGRYLVRAHVAGSSRGRKQGRLDGQDGRGVAVDKANVAGSQRGKRRAIDHGLGVGGNGQRGRRDVERPVDVSDAVIRVDGSTDGDNVVGHVAVGGSRGGECW